jgi:outer membrane protein TolC
LYIPDLVLPHKHPSTRISKFFQQTGELFMPAKGVIAVLLLLLSIKVAAQQNPPEAAPGRAAADQTSTVLTVDAVVREVLAHNPAVESAAHMVSAQRRRVSQARALPDPTVTIGWMGNATPFSVQHGDPSSYRSVSAMQMLPFPGKLKLKGEIAGKDVQAAAADHEAVRRKVESQAKAAFFDYFYYDKALQIAHKDKDLLQKLSQIADARYRVGKGMQQDVLKSQTEISLLLQKITVLQQQHATAQARLNALMTRPLESPLPPAAGAALTPAFIPLPELYQMAEKNSPMLQRDQRMIERGQLAVAAAQKEYRPDLSVGFMYQQRPDMPDMKGMTFTVNIPVFYRSKQRQGVQQAEEEVIAAQKGREDRLNETRFELKQAYLSAKAAKDLADLYSKAVVPQASLALESSMSAYQVGSSDFLTVFSNFSTLLNYEMDYYRQVADYNMALAQMESVIGMDLDSLSAAPADLPSSPAPDSRANTTAAAIPPRQTQEQPLPAVANDTHEGVKR